MGDGGGFSGTGGDGACRCLGSPRLSCGSRGPSSGVVVVFVGMRGKASVKSSTYIYESDQINTLAPMLLRLI